MADRNLLRRGEKVHYTGKGFIGFDPNNLEMEFVRIDETHRIDIHVLYGNKELLVGSHEVVEIT